MTVHSIAGAIINLMHYKLVLAYAGSGPVRSITLRLINTQIAVLHRENRESGRST
jgi:hypothetical protein